MPALTHRLLAAALVVAGLPAWLLLLPAALGQPASSDEPLLEEAFDSPAERQRLYDWLAEQAPQLDHHARIIKTVVRLASPTVVHIEAHKQDNSATARRGTIEEAGSGVIIELDGQLYILTNRHVIRQAELADISINLADGRTIHPRRVWADPYTDVAVMAIQAEGLVAARLGDSDQVEIGDFVLAMGSPFGLSHSVTHGIVSAKGRRDLDLSDDVELQDFVQTDAPINPGNSGGPLINLRGEVIAINTAIASNSGGSEGIGFSIPINMAVHVVRQLIRHGKVVRAFLGVNLDSKFDAQAAAAIGLPRKQGARILSLTPGAPAEAARLEAGDVILRFDGRRVEDDKHLVYLVSLTEVGKEVPLVIFRGGQVLHMTVRVGNYHDFRTAPRR
jgi:serine protease Do